MIYMDYAATTPVNRKTLDDMLPFFSEYFGNPSSIHRLGQQAEAVLESSRESIAGVLNCKAEEIIFTSCGSESDNLALRGVAISARNIRKANHILTTPVEHHAVSETARQLAGEFNFELEFLPVDKFGLVDPEDVLKRIRKDTAVVSVIYANNEIGSINPISDIGNICREKEIPFHTDAVQAPAYLPIDVKSLNVDLMSIGAHKFYGPKGVGVLYKTENLQIMPIQTGGKQEFGLRAGTQNVPLIRGISSSLEIAASDKKNRISKIHPLRDKLIHKFSEIIDGVHLTGHPMERLPNHASFVIEGVNGNSLLMMLDMVGFACSSGSACKTGNPKPSDVLLSIGIDPLLALGSLRITLGDANTDDHIEHFLQEIPGIIRQNRNLGKIGL